jgi:hypothetical protein
VFWSFSTKATDVADEFTDPDVQRVTVVGEKDNPAEIEVRRRARKRDVSFGPRTQDGKRAWDTFMSLAATAKKLNLSLPRRERRGIQTQGLVKRAHRFPSLADLIARQAEKRQLGASWTSE